MILCIQCETSVWIEKCRGARLHLISTPKVELTGIFIRRLTQYKMYKTQSKVEGKDVV